MLFDAVAALFLAYLVGYSADDIVDRLAEGRVLIDRNACYTSVTLSTRVPRTNRVAGVVVTFVEAFGIAAFTMLTLGRRSSRSALRS